MKIRIEPHTLLKASERGATEDEILVTLESGLDLLGKKGKIGKCMVFDLRKRETENFMRKRNWKYSI